MFAGLGKFLYSMARWPPPFGSLCARRQRQTSATKRVSAPERVDGQIVKLVVFSLAIRAATGSDDFAGDRTAGAAKHYCLPGKARHHRSDPETRKRAFLHFD